MRCSLALVLESMNRSVRSRSKWGPEAGCGGRTTDEPSPGPGVSVGLLAGGEVRRGGLLQRHPGPRVPPLSRSAGWTARRAGGHGEEDAGEGEEAMVLRASACFCCTFCEQSRSGKLLQHFFPCTPGAVRRFYKGASFRGALFNNAVLSGSTFEEADLTDADFTDACRRGSLGSGWRCPGASPWKRGRQWKTLAHDVKVSRL